MNKIQWKQWYREQRLSKKEIWKDITGYEGKYQASNLGRIKSLDRRTLYVRKERFYKGKIFTTTTKDYVFAHLCKNKKKKRLLAHRIIATTFIPNPENKPFINHINGIRNDNRVENLEWCTQQENCIHSYYTLGKQSDFFIKNNPAKMGGLNHNSRKVNQYDMNGNFIKQWGCIREITRELGLNASHICKCCKGTQNQTGGYKWSYS